MAGKPTDGPGQRSGAQVPAFDLGNVVPSLRRFNPLAGELSALIDRTSDLCYRAVKTIVVLPDREWSWLHRMQGGSPVPVLSRDDIWLEYGADTLTEIEKIREQEAHEAKPRFFPNQADVSHCLEVLGWLSWLQRERNGRNERKIIVARAYRVSYRSIGERMGRHEDTVRRWEAAGFRSILGEYHVAIEAMG